MPNTSVNRAVIYNKFQLQQETLQWLQSVPNPVCPLVISSVNQFINQCKQDGNWQLLDRFWLFAQCNQANSLVSIKNPTTTAITEVNAPTWAQFQGYTGDGLTQYLDTNFNSSTSGTVFTSQAASIGIYTRTNAQSAGFDMGNADATTVSNIQSRFTDDMAYFRMNATAGAVFNTSNTVTVGLFSSRRSGTNNAGIRNGIVVGTTTGNPAGALVNNNIYIMCENLLGVATGFTTKQYSMAYIGNNVVDNAKLYRAFQTLATQLNFVV